jgi:hypothetical protein
MQLICALFGHQPAPLRVRRRDERQQDRCLICQRTVERGGRDEPWVDVSREAGE